LLNQLSSAYLLKQKGSTGKSACCRADEGKFPYTVSPACSLGAKRYNETKDIGHANSAQPVMHAVGVAPRVASTG